MLARKESCVFILLAAKVEQVPHMKRYDAFVAVNRKSGTVNRESDVQTSFYSKL